MPALITLDQPPPLIFANLFTENWSRPTKRNQIHHSNVAQHATTNCFLGTVHPQCRNIFLRGKSTFQKPFGVKASSNPIIDTIPEISSAHISHVEGLRHSSIGSSSNRSLFLMDLDPATAKLAIAIIGPFLSVFGFLFILRIVMSWYPKLPLGKFPYVLAYAPTEPLLVQTRKIIPPLGGVDVTPVVWFGLLSFLNEILVGPQGLLVLVSQQT